MSEFGGLHFRLRQQAKVMRGLAEQCRARASNGEEVALPASLVLQLAKGVEDAATNLAQVAEAMALRGVE